MNKYYICKVFMVDIGSIESGSYIKKIQKYIGEQVERFNSTVACDTVKVTEVSEEEYLKEE